MGEKKKNLKKKQSNIVFISCITVIVISLFCGIGILKWKDSNKDVKLQVSGDVSVSKEAKSKMNYFIEVASHYDGAGNDVASIFTRDLSELSDDLKLKMAFIGSFFLNKKAVPVAEIPPKYRYDDDMIEKYWSEETLGKEKSTVYELSMEDFENEYQKLFGEKPDYTIDSLEGIGCPNPLLMDARSGKIYLFYQCDGETDYQYIYQTTDYDFDGTYYHVYQDVGFKKEDDYSTLPLVWTFDSDLNFVRTELGENVEED